MQEALQLKFLDFNPIKKEYKEKREERRRRIMKGLKKKI